jgi:hypothetical protein
MVTPTKFTGPDGRVIEPPKDPDLDRDRSIPLSLQVAEYFANAMNLKFADPQTATFLDEKKIALLVAIIRADTEFPFSATLESGCLTLHPALDKTGTPPMLKNISDGVSRINNAFVSQSLKSEGVSESTKFALAMLFQQPLYNTYGQAGMPRGPHTKYGIRG